MPIKTHAKQLRKCPFCRTQIKSKALNISLQDLIRTSKEQEDSNTLKPLTIKQAKKESEISESYIPATSLESNKLRNQILIQEKSEIECKSNKINLQLNAKLKSMDKIREEERDCMDRLDKVKKELYFIRDFIDKQEGEVERLKREKKRVDKELILVDDILQFNN